jgi:mannitol/fructose-specific phosphotransferase system IIA component (Ntr-type)
MGMEIRLPCGRVADNHSSLPRACAAVDFPLPMKLVNLLSPDRMLLDMKAVEHWPSIVELVGHLVTSGQLPESHYEEMLGAFKLREESVSTGIGSGVAIPHAFSDELEQVIAVFGRSEKGIDFEALDNAPVHFIILFVVPRKDYHLHLKTLAAIAKMFTNAAILRQLKTAVCQAEVLSILDSKPSRVSA